MIEQLRQSLQQKLPDFMIPSAFVLLDRFPLNPNGKLDRKALPIPEQHSIVDSSTYVAPRTEIEEQLAQIWANLLGLKIVGVHDNFFHIGGHSLLLTRLVSEMRHLFEVEISIQALFGHPILADMALLIEEAKKKNQKGAQITLQPQVRGEVIPLSFAQQRLWFLDQLVTEKSVYNIPSAVLFKGQLLVQELKYAFQAVIDRHESLRTYFVTNQDGIAQQVIKEKLDELPISEYDLSQLLNSDDKKQAEIDRLVKGELLGRIFDLGKGPLVHLTLIKVNSEEFIICFNMHHIISDGWSMGILSKEFSIYYNHFAFGEALSLKPLAIQYADFAIWQRQWLEGERLMQQLEYWKDKLQGAPEQLDLITDKPRPQIASYQGNSVLLLL